MICLQFWTNCILSETQLRFIFHFGCCDTFNAESTVDFRKSLRLYKYFKLAFQFKGTNLDVQKIHGRRFALRPKFETNDRFPSLSHALVRAHALLFECEVGLLFCPIAKMTLAEGTLLLNVYTDFSKTDSQIVTLVPILAIGQNSLVALQANDLLVAIY